MASNGTQWHPKSMTMGIPVPKTLPMPMLTPIPVPTSIPLPQSMPMAIPVPILVPCCHLADVVGEVGGALEVGPVVVLIEDLDDDPILDLRG